MSRLKANRAREKLRHRLGEANDEALCRLVWAVRNLQTVGGQAHQRVFWAPPEARTTQMDQGLYLLPWMLETLLNELLTAPKRPRLRGDLMFDLDCRDWNTIAGLHDELKRWEDAEEALLVEKFDGQIVPLMHVIERYGHQQFHWQRGDLNPASFYRSARLYGGAAASAHLREQGLSVNALSATGIAIAGAAAHRPYVQSQLDLSPLGVSAEEVRRCVETLMIPWGQARGEAARRRAGRRHPAHAPSLLRLFPGFSGLGRGDLLLVPLPELMMVRITSGIYYDVVGGRDVRNEIGKAFESYVSDLLQGGLEGVRCDGEHRYKVGKNAVDSPDIVASLRGGASALVVECKSTKMNFDAKFGAKALGEGDRGFEEIAKGAYQIWRYVAHCRLGHTGRSLPADIIGVVATLDAWLQISPWGKEALLERAEALAREKSPEIEDQDRIDIAFYPIEIFEHVLLGHTDETALAKMRAAAQFGPNRPTLADTDEPKDGKSTKLYPFLADLGRVLPWWSALEANRPKV